MFNRFIFFWSIAAIGSISGIGIWWMYSQGFSSLSATWTVIFFLLFPILFTLPHVAIDHLPVFLVKIFAWTGSYWFIFVLYSSMFLVLYFILYIGARLLHYYSFWQIWSGRLSFLVCSIVLLCILKGTWNAFHPKYRHITILTSIPLAQKMTLAFITDIHLGPILSNSYSHALIQRLNAANPDAVIFGGDIIDGNIAFVLADGSYKNFTKIKAPLGVYAVYGNHDYFNGDLDAEAALFTPLHFLRNQSVVLNNSVELTGLDDYLHHPVHTIPHRDNSYFKILIDHEPLRIAPASLAGYDLYLSGHTHKGQFFPINLITKRLYVLHYGMRKFGQMVTIVSSGYGFWGPPMRLGSVPEIVLIHIRSTTDSI